jgi:hypothetical protein
MNPRNVDADWYYQNYKNAAAIVRNNLELRRQLRGRDRDQADLAEIEAELEKLDATATDRDLAFCQSKQADELHVTLEQQNERIQGAG